ncbi:MAG: Cof-type HAD-IIB family hydrolase [Buchananella hordeovulneris]|nr:Cof-type HAD-IIB family hydrolase [Buchananella hordeovulneris]
MTISWTQIEPGSVEVKMVVADMDGTLLDERSQLPPGIDRFLAELKEKGIRFVPASGRQYYTLLQMFGDPDLAYIAENGGVVVAGGDRISLTTLGPGVYESTVELVRGLDPVRHAVVACGARGAYVERSDEAFLQDTGKYYARLNIVDDLLAVEDDIVKMAVYDAVDAHESAHLLDPLRAGNQVVVSGKEWIDVMDNKINKGVGVKLLQQSLGITPAQTLAFGDLFNDVEMLAAADYSFAMANAHPEVIAGANYLAPSNAEHGVITVTRALAGLAG